MQIVGLDLSLTSTGVARVFQDEYHPDVSAEVFRLRPGKRKGYERLDWLWHEVRTLARGADLAVVEGASYGSPFQQHQMGGMWYLVTYVLWRDKIPLVLVTPPKLKVYQTGKGRVEKDEALAAVIRRYPMVEVHGNDQADALALAAMGADQLGHPLAEVPATHRRALEGWPFDGS